MATTKVSALSALTAPDGAEELLINDGGTSKKITITNVSKLNLKGGDLTSADPLVIDTDGNYFDVTGTTNFSAMTVAANRQFTLQFDGALTMTHHATNLDLPSEANITTAAGDVATFQATGANTVQCISYTRADGTAIVATNTMGSGFTVSATTDSNATTITQGDDLFFAAGTGITCTTSADGTVTISNTVTDTNTMGSGFTVSATTDTNATTITQGDDLMFTAGTGVTCETTADGTVTIANTAYGKQTIWIPANAMTPTASNGCAAIAAVETTSGRPDMYVLDFDKDSDEFAQFTVAFPKSWNLGTVTYQVFWSGIASADDVDWMVDAVAMNDNETIDVAYGTPIVVTDAAQGAVEELLVSAESGAVTIAGTPADNDLTYFRIGRDVSGDAMAGDARLHGVKIFYTTDALNDA